MLFNREKLFALKQALLKLGSVATEDGTVLVYDNDVLETGAEVFVDGEEGLQPAPDKNYVSGEKTITVEGGIVTAIVEKEIEQPEEEVEETTEEVVEETTEEVAEEVPEEETTEETTEEVTEETVEEPTEEEVIEGPSVDELNGIIDEQKAVIEDLKAQIEELKRKLSEPAAEPAEEEFKNQKPTTTGNSKIDFTKYIKKNKKQ